MTKLRSIQTCFLLLFVSIPANAAVESTAVCGRVTQADPDLLAAFSGINVLGTPVRAVITTDDADDEGGGTCGSGMCGLANVQADPRDDCLLEHPEPFYIATISTTPTEWTGDGYIDTFEFAGSQLSASGTATLVGASRAPGIHPGFASGSIEGTVDLIISHAGSPHMGTVQLESIGSACSQDVPTLPPWALPLMVAAMLGTGAWTLRRGAAAARYEHGPV